MTVVSFGHNAQVVHTQSLKSTYVLNIHAHRRYLGAVELPSRGCHVCQHDATRDSSRKQCSQVHTHCTRRIIKNLLSQNRCRWVAWWFTTRANAINQSARIAYWEWYQTAIVEITLLTDSKKGKAPIRANHRFPFSCRSRAAPSRLTLPILYLPIYLIAERPRIKRIDTIGMRGCPPPAVIESSLPGRRLPTLSAWTVCFKRTVCAWIVHCKYLQATRAKVLHVRVHSARL